MSARNPLALAAVAPAVPHRLLRGLPSADELGTWSRVALDDALPAAVRRGAVLRLVEASLRARGRLEACAAGQETAQAMIDANERVPSV